MKNLSVFIPVSPNVTDAVRNRRIGSAERNLLAMRMCWPPRIEHGSQRPVFLAVTLLVLTFLSASPSAILAAQGSLLDYVVAISLVDLQTGRSVAASAGFIAKPDGTVLTSGYLPRLLGQSPATRRLLILRTNRFYAADVVCTTPPPKENNLVRNVAVLRMRPSDFPFDTWGSAPTTGSSIQVATGFTDPLPHFETLAFGSVPPRGQGVRIVGFERRLGFPRAWIGEGTVWRVFSGNDQSQMVLIGLPNAGVPRDNPGAVILNYQNEVVAMLVQTGVVYGTDVAWAMAVSELLNPCRT